MQKALKPINKAIEDIKKRHQEYLENVIRNENESFQRTIANIEKNRMVLPALCEVVDIPLYDWDNGSNLEVNLGEVPRSKRERKLFGQKLRQLREILGDLKMSDMSVANPKRRTAHITMSSENFPGIRVRYEKKLTGMKCKIVKHKHRAWTSHSVVCEVNR